MRRIVAVAVGVWLVVACGGAVRQAAPVENAPPEATPVVVKGGPRHEVDAVGVVTPDDLRAPPADAEVMPSGLVTRVLKTGTGLVHPRPDDEVVLHYSLWTDDGKLADSSVQRGSPFRARPSQTVPGFSQGVQLMVVGEIRRLWVPEALAYKGQRLPGTLVFDVELIEIVPPRAPPSP